MATSRFISIISGIWQMVVPNTTSAGAGDSGKMIALNASGVVDATMHPAHTGDITSSNGSTATTLATVNSNVGSFTSANITVNAKGLVTAAANGSALWSGLGNPTGALALTMAAQTSTFTYNAATGSGVALFKLTDTASNTGTGVLLSVNTATGSALTPFQVKSKGATSFTVNPDGSAGFNGQLFVNASSNAQGAGLYVGSNGAFINGASTINAANGGFETIAATFANWATGVSTAAAMTFSLLDNGSNIKVGAKIGSVVTVATSGALSADTYFQTCNGGTTAERMRLTAAGKVGIGQTAPSALLHLAAGTAAANTAPIKLASGTVLTTPENGAIEFDGSHLYITIGGTRITIV